MNIIIPLSCIALLSIALSLTMNDHRRLGDIIISEQLDQTDIQKLASGLTELKNNYDAMAYAQVKRDELIKENKYTIDVLTESLKEIKDKK